MYLRKLLITLICLPLFAQGRLPSTPAEIDAKAQDAAKLRAMIEAAPKLPLEQTDLVIKLPEGQELGMVSWVARDSKTGATWLLQRGDKADPVIAVDKDGRTLHSFGKGLYKIPHALRPTIVLAANLGPEVLTGSTRLKAGTATKLLLKFAQLIGTSGRFAALSARIEAVSDRVAAA